MSERLGAWIEREGPSLTAALTERLTGRVGGVFRGAGAEACAQAASRIVAALAADVASGKGDAGRSAMLALVQQHADAGLNYADLRHLTTGLRELVLASLAAAEVAADERRRVEDWLFQLVLVATMRFVAHREEAFQERAAQLEVRQLESQLEQLKDALAEKTQLLEVIRQASSPIATVIDGVLAVPVVGIFDAPRAQALTERLLHAISEAGASALIVDVFGVPVFDTEAAQHLLRLSAAVRLLGTEMILVGLSPATAQTIVGLGVDLSSLKTVSSLQAAVSYVLARRGLQVVPIAKSKPGR